jgi:hypothetical protein
VYGEVATCAVRGNPDGPFVEKEGREEEGESCECGALFFEEANERGSPSVGKKKWNKWKNLMVGQHFHQ